jgi:hypothetical protein
MEATRCLRILISAFLAVTALAVDAGGAQKTNAQAAYAAARVWGYAMKVEALLGVCREMDGAKAAEYDRLFDVFDKEVAPTMVRVYGILQEESIRSGYPAETAAQHLNPSMPRFIARQRYENNPSRFIEQDCRLWRELPAEQDLREMLPDDMKLIDGWR